MNLTFRQAAIAVGALGGVFLVLCVKGVHDQNNGRILTFTGGALALMVPYFLASWIVLRAPPTRFLLVLGLVLAALFRLVALTADNYLSTDLYRYVWDGRMQAAGINPYRYVPADPALAKYRDEEIYPHINRRDYATTMYPPAAQMVFLATTRLSESPRWMRATMVLCDAATIFLLVRLLNAFGLPAQRVLLYAWNPLPIWEFACGGHVDAVMNVLLVLVLLLHRRGRAAATAVALAGAVLAKLFPVALIPALYRRWRYGWTTPAVFTAVCVAGYLPYWLTYSVRGTLGYLSGYASEEGLQSGDRFYLLTLLPSKWLLPWHLSPPTVFRVLAFLLLAGTAAWTFWRRDADERSALRRGLCLATIFTVILSSGYPWYFCWLAPFLVVLPYPWLFWLTVSPLALYLNWIHHEPSDVFLQNSFIYLPAAFLALFAAGRKIISSSPRSVFHPRLSVANIRG